MSGESPCGGTCPAVIAGPPRHTAVPIPSVSVGVTYTRRKFEGAHVPRFHPAEGAQQVGPGTNPSGDIGYTVGIQHGTVPHIMGIPVSALKTGIPDEGVIPLILRGIPKSVGELPGASGAQLSGELRHPPHPNPQESQSKRFCVASIIVSVALGSNSRFIWPEERDFLKNDGFEFCEREISV